MVERDDPGRSFPRRRESKLEPAPDSSFRGNNDLPLDFELPAELEATEPAEARGLRRDAVRLMVSHRDTNEISHTRFNRIGEHLHAGDVLVINTSGTLPAALDATREDGTAIELHLSTHLPADLWLAELRKTGVSNKGTQPFFGALAGEMIHLSGCGSVRLLAPYAHDRQRFDPQPVRLWVAELHLPLPVHDYLALHGFPIRYGYVREPWPLSAYQTVYATEPGSAEMPSAGRAFTPELIARLVAQGVQFAPLVLHTGVASQESHEPPYEEWYRVPEATADLVNAAQAQGRPVIAVGTTAVRALETVSDAHGLVHPGEGWTKLVVTPERGLISPLGAGGGLLTGLHEPRASHLMMLDAIAGREHLRLTYAEALRERYLWHEFGDLHLLLQ
jgi:S-adenosylmethionine:tRNA ribosyltransferase-isomerase